MIVDFQFLTKSILSGNRKRNQYCMNLTIISCFKRSRFKALIIYAIKPQKPIQGFTWLEVQIPPLRPKIID